MVQGTSNTGSTKNRATTCSQQQTGGTESRFSSRPDPGERSTSMGEHMKKGMTSARNNMTPIATAVTLLAMGCAFSANAQQADTATPAQPVTQEVVVKGIRASLQSSIDRKRNSDSIVEVVTAEDVGKMPDKNVADSLQRLPGVFVAAAAASEGSFGENDRVGLRGTPFALTLTTFNGHSVSSGDWFADNIIGGGRSVSFSLFPSELIGGVEVAKGSHADLLDGGAMGVVDIQTRKPLDFKKALTAQANIGAVYSSNAGKTDPQINGLVNWKNDENTFGVLVQAFHEKRTLSRAGQENQIWYDKVDATSPVGIGVPGSAGAVANYLGGTAWFEQVRTREGGLIDLQAKINRDFSLDFSGFYSHLDAPNINHNFMSALGRMLAPSWATTGFPNGYVTGTTSQGVVTQLTGGVPPVCPPCSGMSSAVQEEFSRPTAESKSQFFNVDAKYKANDSLTLDGKIGTTKGVGNTVSGALGVWMPWVGGSYTMHGPDNPITYVIPGANQFSIGGVQATPYTYGSHVTSNDKEDYAQVDATYRTGLPTVPTVKFGARFANHQRDLSAIGINANPSLSNPANLPMGSLTGFPGDFNDLGTNGAGYWTFSQAGVNSWLANNAYYGGELKQNEFTIKEPTQSAYVMANFATEALSGNFGLRIAHTTEDVNRFEIGPSGGFEPREYKNSYVDFLPSANFRMDLAKDWVAHFAVSRTMARPELGQMAGVDLRDIQLVGNVGNPNLAPIRSNNFDFELQWYFADKAYVSADVFYSALDGYVTYGASTATFYNQLQKQNTVYAVSTPLNTTAEVKGLELAYQQVFKNGFGLFVNYSYTDGQETGHAPGSACGNLTNPDCTMIGTSKNAYNLSGFYENDKLSARLTYSYRSDFLNGTSRNNAAFQAPIGTLSATLSYAITDNFTIALDGKDLNNPLVRSVIHTPGAADVPGALYKNGRQIYVTLQAKM